MEIVDNHLVAKNVTQILCDKNKVELKSIPFIVIHYTASTNITSTIKHLQNPKNSVSAHIVIDRLGEIYQLVPFNVQAWHAGGSRYKGLNSLNKYSIGIELLNAGKLTNLCNTFYTYYNTIIPKEAVSSVTNQGIKTFWHKYTSEQIYSLIQVCKALKKEYPEIMEIVGHSDITPRKIDPGKAFPMDVLQYAFSKVDKEK